jgi:hypothetical protein
MSSILGKGRPPPYSALPAEQNAGSASVTSSMPGSQNPPAYSTLSRVPNLGLSQDTNSRPGSEPPPAYFTNPPEPNTELSQTTDSLGDSTGLSQTISDLGHSTRSSGMATHGSLSRPVSLVSTEHSQASLSRSNSQDTTSTRFTLNITPTW